VTAPDRPLRIGTRKSELALRQARQVQRALEARGARSELVTFDTLGDRRLDVPLAAIGGKGLFTAELEAALSRGEIDCAVHSLKDLPTGDAEGTTVVAVLEREDPRDVLVCRPGLVAASIAALPAGVTVGTSSLRRRAQLAALRSDVAIAELRGNVPTRLRKVDAGASDAAILAAAGLVRLGLAGRVTAWLDAPEWLPAPGQGAIAVQARARRDATAALLASLDHAPTRTAVRAERAFLAALEGGCQVPIGALVLPGAHGEVLHGLLASAGGDAAVRGSRAMDAGDPERTGVQLAEELLARGGAAILRSLRSVQGVPSPQPE
jgi:hydroxymethylbilane synthase